VAIERDHHGVVPNTEPELRALPGVGEYTAAAVLAFAFGQRIAVLDTNVRRVIARAVSGQAAAPASLNNAERDLARSLLPRSHSAAAEWSIAIMEFGALICTARNPDCAHCPISSQCAWRAAGCPEPTESNSRRQAWAGTDRQCRGTVMAALRNSEKPVGRIDLNWHDAAQLERRLDSLLDDGLIDLTSEGRFELPN
jgi:A/G-specific adenine glycosylase